MQELGIGALVMGGLAIAAVGFLLGVLTRGDRVVLSVNGNVIGPVKIPLGVTVELVDLDTGITQTMESISR